MPSASKTWKNIFSQIGLELNTPTTGCCGMAGTYGHEKQNYEKSKLLYESSWKKKIENEQIDTILSTGFSCRSQVKRFEGKKPLHPIEFLASKL
jgi:Fe-S oxidoreductase